MPEPVESPTTSISKLSERANRRRRHQRLNRRTASEDELAANASKDESVEVTHDETSSLHSNIVGDKSFEEEEPPSLARSASVGGNGLASPADLQHSASTVSAPPAMKEHHDSSSRSSRLGRRNLRRLPRHSSAPRERLSASASHEDINDKSKLNLSLNAGKGHVPSLSPSESKDDSVKSGGSRRIMDRLSRLKKNHHGTDKFSTSSTGLQLGASASNDSGEDGKPPRSVKSDDATVTVVSTVNTTTAQAASKSAVVQAIEVLAPEAVLDQEEHPVLTSPKMDPPEEKDGTIEAESSEAEPALDFRPLDSEPAVKATGDSTWDSNKVLFSEFQDESKRSQQKKDTVDVFGGEWPTESDVEFSDTVNGTRWARNVNKMEEEKKEKEVTQVEPAPSVELDLLGWPRVEESATAQEEEPLHVDEADDDDAQNLLGGVSSSDACLTDEKRITKEERIGQYTTTTVDEESDREEPEGDEDWENEDQIVEYVAQQETEDDNDNKDCIRSVNNESPKADFVPIESTSKNIAQFVLPTDDQLTSEKKSGAPKTSPRAGLPPLSLSQVLPPPPPPLGSKKKKTGRSVPLLRPPPAEKLKKWEEEKNRGKSFLATKVEKENAKLDPPTGNRVRGVPSGESMASSQVSSSSILQDGNMAAKVDAAISRASLKYEEQASRDSGDSKQQLSCLNDGAFTSWNMPTGMRSSGGKCGMETIDKRNKAVLRDTLFVSANVETPSPRTIFPPDEYPSPFELTVSRNASVLSKILEFLGDPVAVSRMKMVNKACNEYVGQNEYRLMRDAVRLGDMSMNVRPYFWLWVILDKSFNADSLDAGYLNSLEQKGRDGKWSHVIERDVSRSFGNLPPHKTGARLRTDSIVRALATWGRCRILKRGVKGDGQAGEPVSLDHSTTSDMSPTDTVSDWGGVQPVGSFTSMDDSVHSPKDGAAKRKMSEKGEPLDGEFALSGNSLTEEVKVDLQRKLGCILHAMAASHEDVGYCQGMDYVVAHLLRILQDTIRWKAVVKLNRPLTPVPKYDQETLSELYLQIDKTQVVEETCFQVMECFFTKYNLSHFYFPELRCLKTCCRVFEKLIQQKLPVLADHFEHHELNVGLFALGWFQTLFLYLPSMPSATVCHMWDIWLVERSYKIFYRVGTAILFLSQPILLNHELEGMMGYLNTFPDATLLSPDILIACALQIKVTNEMLMDLEREVLAEQ